MNDEEVIEILDELEDNTLKIAPIKNVSIGLRKGPEPLHDVIKKEEPTPVVDIKETVNTSVNQINATIQQNLENIEYSPIKPEKEEVEIEVEEVPEETKSGLGFVIVLFILLAAFIMALPYISKLF